MNSLFGSVCRCGFSALRTRPGLERSWATLPDRTVILLLAATLGLVFAMVFWLLPA